jgi:hypothetical protein
MDELRRKKAEKEGGHLIDIFKNPQTEANKEYDNPQDKDNPMMLFTDDAINMYPELTPHKKFAIISKLKDTVGELIKYAKDEKNENEITVDTVLSFVKEKYSMNSDSTKE